jgi:hypothetical protein
MNEKPSPETSTRRNRAKNSRCRKRKGIYYCTKTHAQRKFCGFCRWGLRAAIENHQSCKVLRTAKSPNKNPAGWRGFSSWAACDVMRADNVS